MLSNKRPVLFIKPTKTGHIEVYMGKDKQGNKQTATYDQVTGKVLSVQHVTSEWEGKPINKWQIRMQDANNDAVLTVGESGGFTKGLLNSLCSADLTQPVTIGCYLQNDFMCASVSQNNQLVKWKYQSPPKSEKVVVGSKEVYDDSKVVAWLHDLAEEINKKIESQPLPDLPAGFEAQPPDETDILPF